MIIRRPIRITPHLRSVGTSGALWETRTSQRLAAGTALSVESPVRIPHDQASDQNHPAPTVHGDLRCSLGDSNFTTLRNRYRVCLSSLPFASLMTRHPIRIIPHLRSVGTFGALWETRTSQRFATGTASVCRVSRSHLFMTRRPIRIIPHLRSVGPSVLFWESRTSQRFAAGTALSVESPVRILHDQAPDQNHPAPTVRGGLRCSLGDSNVSTLRNRNRFCLSSRPFASPHDQASRSESPSIQD